MLIRIAEVFEVQVSELLGAKVGSEKDINIVAEQLSRINEQLAIKNRRSHRIWKTITIVIVALVAFNIFLFAISAVNVEKLITTETETVLPEK